ncbi:hypothetical protein BJ508DRAFT_305768 [Ascobolus immersus RN42]|uniref:Uncharacterized protein n=1 Tax=Ascobolus immersus RN42 TaxID=1160509 RepID=A0A3N4IA85_ASCIM|nr:hypothetical protein BJ508DRAFT_305768 [Ascobolus immersus RN42]
MAFPSTLLPPLLTLTSLLPPPPSSPKAEQEQLHQQPRHILDNLAFLIACGQEAAISCVSREDQTVIHVACAEEENVVACRAIANVIEEYYRRRNDTTARQKLLSIVLRHNAPYLHWYLTLKFQTQSGLHILRSLLRQPFPEPTGDEAADQTASLLFFDSHAHLQTITNLIESALTLASSGSAHLLQTYEKLIDSAHLTLSNKPFHNFLTYNPHLEGHKTITWLQKLARFKGASTAVLEFMKRDFDGGKARFGRISVNGIGVQGSAIGAPGVYRPRDRILGVLAGWVFPPNPHFRGLSKAEREKQRDREVEEGIRRLCQVTGKDKEALKRAVGRYQKRCHPELALVKYHLENPSGRGWRVGKNIGVPGRVCKCCEVFLGEVGGGWKVDTKATTSSTRAFVAGWWVPNCEAKGWEEARTSFARDLMEEIRTVLQREAPIEMPITFSIPPRALPTPPPMRKSRLNKSLPSLPKSTSPPPVNTTWPTSPTSGLETPPHSASSSDPPETLIFPQDSQQTGTHPPTPPNDTPAPGLLEAPTIVEKTEPSPTQTDFSLAPSSPFITNPDAANSAVHNQSTSSLFLPLQPASAVSSQPSLHGPQSSHASMASLHGPQSSQPSMISLHGPQPSEPSMSALTGIFSPTRPSFPSFPRNRLIREPTPQEGAMRDIYEVLELEDKRFREIAGRRFEGSDHGGDLYAGRLTVGRYRDEESRDDLHGERDRMVITPTSYGGSGFFSVISEETEGGYFSRNPHAETAEEREAEMERREMNITPTTLNGDDKAFRDGVRELRLQRERMVETPSDLDLDAEGDREVAMRGRWVEGWLGQGNEHDGQERRKRENHWQGAEEGDGDADTVVPSRGGTPRGFPEEESQAGSLMVPTILVQPASSEEPSELTEEDEPSTATKTAFDFPSPPPMPTYAPPPPPPTSAPPPPPPTFAPPPPPPIMAPPPPPVDTEKEDKDGYFSPVPRQAVQRRAMSNIFPEPFSLPAHLKRDIPDSAPSPLFASTSQTSLKKVTAHHRTNSLPVIPLGDKLAGLNGEKKEEKEQEKVEKAKRVFSMWAAKTRPVSPLFKQGDSDTTSAPRKITADEAAPPEPTTAPPPPPGNPLTTTPPRSFLQSRLQRAATAFAALPTATPENLDTTTPPAAVPAAFSSPRPNRKNRSMSFPTPPEATSFTDNFPYPAPPTGGPGTTGSRLSLVNAVNLVRRAAPGALEGMPTDLPGGVAAGPHRRKLSIADIARQMKAQQAALEGRPIRPSFADIARTMQMQQMALKERPGAKRRPSLADIARQMQMQQRGKSQDGADGKKKLTLAEVARQMALKEAAKSKAAGGGKKLGLAEIAKRAKAAQAASEGGAEDPAASTASLASTAVTQKQPTLKDLLTPTIASQLSSILSTHSASVSSLRSAAIEAQKGGTRPKPPKVACQLLPSVDVARETRPVDKAGGELNEAEGVKGEGVVGAWSSGGVESEQKEVQSVDNNPSLVAEDGIHQVHLSASEKFYFARVWLDQVRFTKYVPIALFV